MKRPCLIFLLLLGACHVLRAQKTSLPISRLNSTDTTKPVVFYISGDGGFNKFSTSLMQNLNRQGYAVIGLNAKEYFWKKRTPKEAAGSIESVINESALKQKNIVLIGYSFGADVAPFMVTHFSAAVADKVAQLILLSPSPKTDFEIHVLQMLGWGDNSGESVPAEINKTSKPVIIITGDDESGFPFAEVTLKNKKLIKMAGGHHYDGDVAALCKQIVSQMK